MAMKKMPYFVLAVFLSTMMCTPEIRAQTWTNLGGGMGRGRVNALAFDANGNLYAGGSFSTAGGVAANNIAKWNGSSWANLGDGLSARGSSEGVKVLVFDTYGNLYAGGSFTNAGRVAANYIAKWDGANWSSFGSDPDSWYGFGKVNAIVCNASGLYAGGECFIAKWDGSSWAKLGDSLDYQHYNPFYWVNALAFDARGNLYAGGNKNLEHGIIAKWDVSTWTTIADVYTHIYTNTHSFTTVYSLACDASGNLYAGGVFDTADGVEPFHIAKWNGSRWTKLGSGIGHTRGVNALAFDASGNLYAGGDFTTAGDVAANSIAKWIPPVIGPVIKANGQIDNVIINYPDAMSITVEMNADNYAGAEVDWWVIAFAYTGQWYYMNNVYQWSSFNGDLAFCHPVYQGPLANLPSTPVLSGSLPRGTYGFWFAVDYPMNGIMNGNAMLYDNVTVVVQ